MTLLKPITMSILLFNTIFFSYGTFAAENSRKSNSTPTKATATLNKLVLQNNGGDTRNNDIDVSCTINSNPDSCDPFLKICAKAKGKITIISGGYHCHVVRPSRIGNGINLSFPN